MRLDRLLASAGCGSRTEIKKWLRAGRIQIDQVVVSDSGQQINQPDQHVITIDGQPFEPRRYLHIMMHKPAGLITALEDHTHPTIAGLLSEQWLNRGLVPIGRLDRDTTGLLLLTNDGTLCHRLASPRWSVGKTYAVTVSGSPLSEDDQKRFAAGLHLPDGLVCQPAQLEIIDGWHANLEIHEGKYHQVKRMMLAGGHQVEILHRYKVGPITLDDQLEPGASRFLSEAELNALYRSVHLQLPQF